MKTYIARTTGDASHDYTNESSKKKGYIDSSHQFVDNELDSVTLFTIFAVPFCNLP